MNDSFTLEGTDWQFYYYNFTICYRWGELFYESSTLEETWDCAYLGNLVQTVTYVWIINFRDILLIINDKLLGGMGLCFDSLLLRKC
ncbi:MAG: hypothetical protein CMP61_07110 [Flavobacteriales bacterium]|nr:hypothetical protein [Flavobacteriales bacterium]